MYITTALSSISASQSVSRHVGDGNMDRDRESALMVADDSPLHPAQKVRGNFFFSELGYWILTLYFLATKRSSSNQPKETRAINNWTPPLLGCPHSKQHSAVRARRARSHTYPITISHPVTSYVLLSCYRHDGHTAKSDRRTFTGTSTHLPPIFASFVRCHFP